MGFKYINPGVYPFQSSYVTRSTDTRYSKFGLSFTMTNSSYFNLFSLDEYFEEAYAMFDVYVPSASSVHSWGIRFSDTADTTARLLIGYSRNSRIINKKTSYYPNLTFYSYYNSTQRTMSMATNGYNSLNSLSGNTRHTVFLHLLNKGIAYMTVNNNVIVDRSDETHEDTTSSTYCCELKFNSLQVQATSGCYLSNFILSDSRITPNETMIEVPISSTSTNMTESSGVYTASSVGKYILQTPNKSSLVSSYPNHRVTGISTVAQPAYTDGTPTTIAGRESSLKHDSTVLTTSNAAGTLSSWKANLPMSQIDSKQYGWEVIA